MCILYHFQATNARHFNAAMHNGVHLWNSPRTITNSEGCQKGSARPLAGTSLRSCARLLRNLRGFPPKVSLSAAHSRFASASRHRTAFLLEGDVCGCGFAAGGWSSPNPSRARCVDHTLGITDAAIKHICHLLAAESCGAPGVTLVKPFASHRSFSPRWVKNADAPGISGI